MAYDVDGAGIKGIKRTKKIKPINQSIANSNI